MTLSWNRLKTMNQKKTAIKKAGYMAFAMAAWVCFLGMGGLGGESSSVLVPQPIENYRALVVDQSDESAALTHFSFNGVTFITGRLGKADVSIDFKKIDKIFFLADGDVIVSRVRLQNGDVIELGVKKGSFFLGVSSFGNFRIKVEDIKTISFGG